MKGYKNGDVIIQLIKDRINFLIHFSGKYDFHQQKSIVNDEGAREDVKKHVLHFLLTYQNPDRNRVHKNPQGANNKFKDPVQPKVHKMIFVILKVDGIIVVVETCV